MTDVNSFADLQKTAPAGDGEMVYLKRYYDNDVHFRGGGHFVGFKGAPPVGEDGGTVVKGPAHYWKRVIDNYNTVTLFHFGARGDGHTDDSGAFKNMLKWTASCVDHVEDLPVRFPPGTFLIKPMDLSATEVPFFAIQGDDSAFGVTPRTTIVSDLSANTVFHIKARRLSIRGITWDGRVKNVDTSKYPDCVPATALSNVQPFLQNDTIEGEFVNIYGFRVQNSGGTVIKLIDTLDTRLEQIYSSNTYGRVFDIGWSNSPNANWDHATAIELSNANFQSGFGDATLYMPRVTQGLIRNVWIEHTLQPGNLSDGQWIIDALSVESSKHPLHLHNSRVLFRQLSLQSGAQWDQVNPGTSKDWGLSGFEMGWRRDENYGTEMSGSLKTGWFSGYRLNNDTPQDKWFEIGAFYFPVAHQIWTAEFHSNIAEGSHPAATGVANLPPSSGVTRLNMFRGDNAIRADISHSGSPALTDIRCEPKWKDVMNVWVKLQANSGSTVFNLTSSGPTRYDAGTCSLFTPQLKEVQEAAVFKGKPSAALSLHNGVAGIGANEKGMVTLVSATATAVSGAHPSGYVVININGHDKKIPFYD